MITGLQLYHLNAPQAECIRFIALLDKCTQSLAPLPQDGHKFRDIYGKPVALGMPSLRYTSIISGQGLCGPSMEALSVGAKLLVHCIHPLYTEQVQGGTIISLTRPCVPGSVFLMNHQRTHPLSLETEAPHRKVRIPEGSSGYLSYCPVLAMSLTHFEMKVVEDQELVMSWTLHLEEI